MELSSLQLRARRAERMLPRAGEGCKESQPKTSHSPLLYYPKCSRRTLLVVYLLLCGSINTPEKKMKRLLVDSAFSPALTIPPPTTPWGRSLDRPLACGDHGNEGRICGIGLRQEDVEHEQSAFIRSAYRTSDHETGEVQGVLLEDGENGRVWVGRFRQHLRELSREFRRHLGLSWCHAIGGF